MANNGNEDFYYNLSRKELQTLCKRYGLPANKSHSDLAMSLIAYLQEGFGGPMYNLWGNFYAQCNGNGLSHNEYPRKYSVDDSLGLARDRTMENVPETESREINFSAYPAQTAVDCSVETPTQVPSSSFEFHVRSEEGINLYVDFNSSLSEWTKRFKSEVCTCQNVHRNKSMSLYEDLGCIGKGDKEKRSSFIQNINYGYIEDKEPTKSDNVGLDHSVKLAETSVTSAVRSCNMAADASEHLVEDQALVSSKLDSAPQKQRISGAHSFAKDGSLIKLDSNVLNNFQKSICAPAVNSLSKGQLSPVIIEHQNSNLNNCLNPTLQNNYSPVNLSVVYPGCSASASIEMQSSEVVSFSKDISCSPCGNGGLVGLFVQKDNLETELGIISSCEQVPDLLGNYVPKSAEAWERNNITNGRDSPECSQLTSSVEKNSFCYDNLESNEELSRKRKHIEGELQSGYGNPDAKNLTSRKHITRKVLPRRSVRLISKVF
ncbi:hypothetical protein EV1_031568 [Malus domestica]